MCYSALIKRDLKNLEYEFGAVLVREQFDKFTEQSEANPKRFPKVAERIFPGSYAPIIYESNGRNLIEIMRYGAYTPVAEANPGKFTTFNARRDNLSSPFWSNSFMKHHGFVVLEGFFEWVEVKDLLRAGVVKISEIEAEFKRQALARQIKLESAGKKYKPSKTELTDARFRKTIIQFYPEDGMKLIVPVIFSRQKLADGYIDGGFAIVTDEPTPEIRIAGHDRCPVVLESSALSAWLDTKKSASIYDKLLQTRRRLTFKHRLDQVA